MEKKDLEKFICNMNTRLVDAMKTIDTNAICLVYVVDDEGKLVGCLSDGDIRRWIISTGEINSFIKNVMNKQPKYVFSSAIDKAHDVIERNRINSLPILDKDRHIIDVYIEKKGRHFFQYNNLLENVPIIIMAGGLGTRLYPYTKILPKPLIPIGDIPILERIIKQFQRYGVRECYLILNYKKEMIKSYLNDIKLSVNLSYVEEQSPLGTAGGINLISKPFKQSNVFVTNCDILIESDYAKIYDFHVYSNNDMTIVSSLRKTTIPYGVLHSKEDGMVITMEEKPEMSFLINTGMYIVKTECLDYIPANRMFHMTELAELLLSNGKKVATFPISENSFLDMGEFEELKKMEERISLEYGG